MTFSAVEIESPVGKLTLIADEKSLRGVLWENDELLPKFLAKKTKAAKNLILSRAKKQLHEYFSGKRKTFDIPIHFEGTKFQKRVWNSLRKIPYGKTQSYSGLAKTVGSPKACRAVGAANSKNPISIIVPCHRVIGADGKLVGFGGGLNNKEVLLNLESSWNGA